MSSSESRSRTSEPLPTREAFDALCKDASKGLPEAVAELNRLLDAHPEIWTDLGDVSRHVELQIILAIAGDNALMQESVRRQVAKLRMELGGDDINAMERLLLDRFIVCWLQSHHLDLLHPTCGDTKLQLGRYILAQKEAARKQLQSALEALQTYRRTAAPPGKAGRPALKIHTG